MSLNFAKQRYPKAIHLVKRFIALVFFNLRQILLLRHRNYVEQSCITGVQSYSDWAYRSLCGPVPNEVRRAKARSEVRFPAGEIDTVPNRIRLHTKAHLITEKHLHHFDTGAHLAKELLLIEVHSLHKTQTTQIISLNNTIRNRINIVSDIKNSLNHSIIKPIIILSSGKEII